MGDNTINIVEKVFCMGCGLCAEKCPQNCITMLEDKEGFRFPNIDTDKCVKCGLCLRFCPAESSAETLYNKEQCSYYCGIIKNKDMLLKSSSGGVFGALAENIIDNGGYVCGCVYSDDLEAVHLLSNKKEDIERMYGSKYVQSRSEQCFPEILNHLDNDDTVLFTGTACQIAALRLFVGKEYQKLYCVEILCHGVPSPGLFRQYKLYLETKLNGKVKDIRFRDKRKDGWGSEHRTCVLYNNKKGALSEYRPVLPAYFSSFFYGLSLRESCYRCRFATSKRVADLTIGDYWGAWKKYRKRFNKGISVMGVNTFKGKKLLDCIQSEFSFFESLNEDEAVTSNDNFEHPIKRPVERAEFYSGITQKGYRGLWKKTYLTKTYRKKTVASFYGAFIPEKVRITLHSLLDR